VNDKRSVQVNKRANRSMTKGGKNDKSVAPKSILGLVERFELYQESYRSGQYNEAQLRHDFLDPFWETLGWDIHNKQGFAEAYRDVVYEDALRIGHATKAPDYCFRIGGTRKFFLEAKKPSVLIKEDVSPAFQLRRYAWSAKLPLSILSNFEEFVVYDTHVRPVKDDPASTARIFYCTFREYAEKWDWIASVFSRDAVLKGSFDKFAEGTRAKRGTASVDDAFLDEIESWRKSLAQNLALRNPKLTQRELNFAVQSIIDRIIFLRICEDRNIEDYGRLLALVNGGDIYQRLCELFQEADDKYNSGLFHFKAENGRHEPPDELTPGLHVDDKLLRDVLRNLYYPESPYEFSVLSIDILGQVYERFLGKTIRLTEGHRAVVEDKPEVKKAGGVYYTPTYIVNYIIKNTVGKLLEGKTPIQAAKLRILDPACGSGSFLIGAYQYLLDWHLDWYVANDPKRRTKGSKPALLQAGVRGWRLTIAERKRILLNNIFGVDIDSQAVEVTKLSLLLKVLEGETEQTLQPMLRFLHERALPDLGDNIKCGNSLIGSDFYEGQQMSLLDDEDRFRINVFDWQAEFPGIMKAGGFDAVAGNPPYGAYFYAQDKAYLTSRFTCQTYQLDSYLLFLERAVRDLLRLDGLYGMIIPNPWLTNLLQTTARRFVVGNSRVREIVHFKFSVFPRAVVDTEIVLLQKSSPRNWEVVVSVADTIEAFLSGRGSPGFRQIRHDQDKWRRLDGAVINIFTTPTEETLAQKCLSKSSLLDSLCDINVGIKPYQVGKGNPPQTKSVVESRPFDSDRPKDKTFRPYLRGSDINRYVIAPLAPRYLKYGPWLAEPRPAANFDAPLKIVMRQTGDCLVAALDTSGRLCLNNMHVLVPRLDSPSPKFLIGLINSKLLNWYYQTLNPEKGEALAEVKKTNVARLPIRTINLNSKHHKAYHDSMVEFVERMAELHRKQAAAKTPAEQTTLARQIAALDRQIDRLVYELYGLTEQEIKIVESAT
jgi:hypothetical protein